MQKNYLEGYKDAIQKKTMDQLLPNISAPQMPMQQPMQQPYDDEHGWCC